MWNIVDGTIQNITLEQIFQSNRATGTLVQWAEASSKSRPAVVFIPGFLTEKTPINEDPLSVWRKEIIAYAKKKDMAAFAVYWPSTPATALIMNYKWLRLTGAIDTLKLAGIAMAGPMLLNPIPLGLSMTVVMAARRMWKRAVQNADEVAENPFKWLGNLDREIVLIGHSLGGRIALKACANVPGQKIKKVYAMAPAVLKSECQPKKITQNTKSKGTVYYSEHDWILQYAFRIGEFTTTLPIGFDGKINKLKKVDASKKLNREVGHIDYAKLCRKLL